MRRMIVLNFGIGLAAVGGLRRRLPQRVIATRDMSPSPPSTEKVGKAADSTTQVTTGVITLPRDQVLQAIDIIIGTRVAPLLR